MAKKTRKAEQSATEAVGDAAVEVAKVLAPTTSHAAQSSRLTVILTLVIQVWLLVALVFFIVRGNWENAFLTLTVIALNIIPAFVLRRYRIHLPAEFQLIAAAFVFLSLFLGSVRDYYYRFWWWDIVLHISSGFLLGIVGWVVLFLLNQTDRLPKGIRPSFLSFFGVTFAVTLGVFWEIFEFIVDKNWPEVNMMSHETGVDDTMHDLIVDTIGAVIVGVMGWVYFKTGKYSYLVDAVNTFVQKNPRLFRRKGRASS